MDAPIHREKLIFRPHDKKKQTPMSPSSLTASPLHPCSLLLMYTSKNNTKQNILLFEAAAQATKLIPRL
jgi:hypothetical protein